MAGIRFIYRSSNGDTERYLEAYSIGKGCISGYCLISGGFRSFRIDRILRTLEGGLPDNIDVFDVDFAKETAHEELEICFTGFSSKLKSELSEKAASRGMKVRANVTQNLDFLCCGDNAGPSKINKAHYVGAIAISEEQFADLLEHGVLPTLSTS